MYNSVIRNVNSLEGSRATLLIIRIARGHYLEVVESETGAGIDGLSADVPP